MSTCSNTPLYDAFIPFHEKDADILPYCIAGLRQNAIGLRTIFVISKEDPAEENCTWIPESEFPLEINWGKRSGWYYQQILKLYCFRILGERALQRMLLFDSDVVLTHPIHFVDREKIYLDLGDGNLSSIAYVEHMERLFKGEILRFPHTDTSEITDYMFVERDILEEMLLRIEAIHEVSASTALLQCVDPATIQLSGMSEYTLHSNYLMSRYPSHIITRKLRRFDCNDIRQLSLYADKVDILTFHSWCRR